MQGVQPGTAQNIPEVMKWIILVLSVVAVALTATWGKVSDSIKSRKKNKPETKA